MSKKQTIVVKKIIVQAAGHHGGSWKVALADFMTAMMAFFLVMWLLGQSEETKKAISDYFSTPSVIEYNFQNYGAEITLEKLFLDFINEPLKTVQTFMEPQTKSPNILDMGSEKVVAAYMADKMTDVAKNVSISQDGFDFDIPDTYLFEKGTSTPKVGFVDVMDKLTAVTAGLKDAEIKITAALFIQQVEDRNINTANRIATERLTLVQNKVSASFDSPTNEVTGYINVKEKQGEFDPERLIGFVRVNIRQKPTTDPNQKRRKLERLFSKSPVESANTEPSTLENSKPAEGQDPNLVNPVDIEVNKLEYESFPVNKKDF
ncbi:MAG: flagellar motor protein MotB [Pseudobdellovibrio sp.]